MFDNIDGMVKSTSLIATFGATDNIAITSPDIICAAGYGDPQDKYLINTVQHGFPQNMPSYCA